MKKQRYLHFAIAFIGAVCVSGCSGKNRGMIPSTSPLPAGVHGSVVANGDNCQFRLLGILPFTGPPNTQAALAEAKQMSGVEVLTDVTIDETRAWYVLFSNRCVHVDGMGVTEEDLKKGDVYRMQARAS